MKTTVLRSALAMWLLIASIEVSGSPPIASTPAVALSQQRAVDRYPDIGVKGSDLNLTFVDVFNHWKIWKPLVLQRDDWPEIVAEHAVLAIRARIAEEQRLRETQVLIRP